jgi:hypothetical protein
LRPAADQVGAVSETLSRSRMPCLPAAQAAQPPAKLQIDAAKSTPSPPASTANGVRRPWLAEQSQAQRRLGQRETENRVYPSMSGLSTNMIKRRLRGRGFLASRFDTRKHKHSASTECAVSCDMRLRFSGPAMSIR